VRSEGSRKQLGGKVRGDVDVQVGDHDMGRRISARRDAAVAQADWPLASPVSQRDAPDEIATSAPGASL